MGVLGRIFAMLTMGAILLALVGFPVGIMGSAWWASLGPTNALIATLAPSLVAVILTIAIASAAPTARIAWGRLALMASLAAFALPLEAFVFSLGVGVSARAASSDAVQQAAYAAGAVVATSAATAAFALLGFFLGIIFALIAYFALRGAPRPMPLRGREAA